MASERILLKVCEQTSEHWALIVGPVFVGDKVGEHVALFEGDFFDAELPCKSAKPGHTKKFGGFGGYFSESVDKA